MLPCKKYEIKLELFLYYSELIFRFREHGYSTDYLIDFSVVTDSKNSSWRVIDIDQASLGMSREYLINGIDDDDVTSYFNYMVIFLRYQ